MGSAQTKVVERVDYPEIVFRAVDHIGKIIGADVLDHNQLGRAVDYLYAVTYPLRLKYAEKKTTEATKIPSKTMKPSEYYDSAQLLIVDVMELLQNAGLLTRRTRAADL